MSDIMDGEFLIATNWYNTNRFAGNSRVAIAPAEDAMIRFKIAWKCDNPIEVKYSSMMPRKL